MSTNAHDHQHHPEAIFVGSCSETPTAHQCDIYPGVDRGVFDHAGSLLFVTRPGSIEGSAAQGWCLPQYPSQLSSQAHLPHHARRTPLVDRTVPNRAGATTTATSMRAASTPRRRLTDSDRKKICKYAENHPKSTQKEIGGEFAYTSLRYERTCLIAIQMRSTSTAGERKFDVSKPVPSLMKQQYRI